MQDLSSATTTPFITTNKPSKENDKTETNETDGKSKSNKNDEKRDSKSKGSDESKEKETKDGNKGLRIKIECKKLSLRKSKLSKGICKFLLE